MKDRAQTKLINNLKKQLDNKKERYNQILYRAVILKIADEKIPVSKQSYLDINTLGKV